MIVLVLLAHLGQLAGININKTKRKKEKVYLFLFFYGIIHSWIATYFKERDYEV